MHRKTSLPCGGAHNTWVDPTPSLSLPAGAPINSVSAGRLSLDRRMSNNEGPTSHTKSAEDKCSICTLLCETANASLGYKIPDDIKARIPDYFYYAFGGEYVSIAGKDALFRNEDGLCALELDAGTAGYVAALRATCRKLDMGWLVEYWDSLPWYLSDAFDSELIEMVLARFERRENANSYYRYVLKECAEENAHGS